MNRLSARSWRRIACWLTFAASLITYLLTLEPDASLWDCPEYLVTATMMEIGHPPGNPVWSLTARMFSLFGGGDPHRMAVAVNASSAVFTAGAAALLCSVACILFRFVGPRRREYPVWGAPLLAMATGLTFAWLDSPWYSAVEAEVYAMSLFLTALSVRLMVGWAFIRSPRRRARHLLLIIYLTGLSIGVHQLNLLVIPALALIWLFRNRRGKVGGWRILLTIILSGMAVGAILLGFMPGMIRMAAGCELFCVNRLHMPLHSGVWIFWISALIFTALLGLLPQLLRRPMRPGVQVLLWTPALLLTGYSAYMMLLVRSAANPPMNEGAPTNIFALQEYLNREQYGSTPLLYGRTPYSRPMRLERINADGTPDYSRLARKSGEARYLPSPDGRSYRHFADRTEVIYTPELNMWLPRLTSQNDADIASYGDWAGMWPEEMTEVEVSYALDSLGNPVGKLQSDGSRIREKEMRPTYLHQLRYLLGYQSGYMYFRYLLWNFSGRQNDRFAAGEVEHGNFITGIDPVDALMVGPRHEMPDEIGDGNPGHNRYFLIPLLIGILGMGWLQRRGSRGRRANLVILMLFLMTGLVIVLYINQSPREPRERDYTFLGSFWAYTLWLGAGLWAMALPLLRRLHGMHLRSLPGAGSVNAQPRERLLNKYTCGAGCLVVAMTIPVWMLATNYEDHDRSGRSVTTDFAANLLNSLEPDAILFTNGDNFTFPLWWAQEVVGLRRDVTIINTAYLATPWYVCQLMTERPGEMPGKTMPGLRMQAPDSLVRYGTFAFTPYHRSETTPSAADSARAVDALSALRALYADPQHYRMPAMLRLPAVGGDSIWVRSAAVASGSSMIGQRQLAAFDIIASNQYERSPRPVYWLSSLTSSDYAGFHPFTTRTLHTRHLIMAPTIDEATQRHLLDADFRAALTTLSGRRGTFSTLIADTLPPLRIYADPTVGTHITTQRLGLLRLAQRLIAAGRPADALKVTRIVQRYFPPEIWEYQICNESDGSLYEGEAIARILRDVAESCTPQLPPDTLRHIHAEADSLLRREKARQQSWLRYRRSLPEHLRPMLTPKHRQWTSHSIP